MLNRYSNSPALHLVPHDPLLPACLIGGCLGTATLGHLASQGSTDLAAGVFFLSVLVIANAYRRWQRVFNLQWSAGHWQVRTRHGWTEVTPTPRSTALGAVVIVTLVGNSPTVRFARCLVFHSIWGRNNAANLRRLRVRLRLEGCL